MDNHKHPSLSDNETELFSSLHIRQLTATNYDDFWQKTIKKFRLVSGFGRINCLIGTGQDKARLFQIEKGQNK